MNRLDASSRWSIILVVTVAVVGACLWTWSFAFARPYVAAFGAALAALLAPLPGFITPETRGKWIFAVVLAGTVGLGAWYSANDIEAERDDAVRRRAEFELKTHDLTQQLVFQRESFQELVNDLKNNQPSKFLLNAAQSLHVLYGERRFDHVLDLSGVVAAFDPENGHALYYQGEAYRSLGSRTDMRGAFQKYLAVADGHAEATKGSAHDCYERAQGYCGERTAWVNHLMANDYYRNSLGAQSSGSSDLSTSLRYERAVLAIRSRGFYGDQSVQSSCSVLRKIAESSGSSNKDRHTAETLSGSGSGKGPC